MALAKVPIKAKLLGKRFVYFKWFRGCRTLWSSLHIEDEDQIGGLQYLHSSRADEVAVKMLRK